MPTQMFIFIDSMDSLLPPDDEFDRVIHNQPNKRSGRQNKKKINGKINPSSDQENDLRGNISGKHSKDLLGSLLLFIFLTLSSGWIGVLLQCWTNESALAVMPFMVIPPAFIIFFMTTPAAKNLDLGIKLNIKPNIVWYAFALLFPMTLVTLVLLIGHLSEVQKFDALPVGTIKSILSAILGYCFFNFISVALGELSWRGFTTTLLRSLGTHPLLNHLVTGLLWLAWSIPYWVFMLDHTGTLFKSYENLWSLILLQGLLLISSSVLLGEFRSITNTIWPGIIVNLLINALTISIIESGAFQTSSSFNPWFSPLGGVITSMMILIVGLIIHRGREKNP